ncbi:Hpt domain-containing protein [Paenibacillus koleovorans]|uniref:Hpt domain-containing protein n=1 Tax=Paenibacillus koleovorans TaxID=121608 RepID=UPI000FD95B47|nr:Hpt domain-containing protein [Paenibacillus koleovorans]
MQNPEFNQKMKRIIEQSQRMYLADAAPRIAAVQAAYAEWLAGRVERAAAAESIYSHVHAMKGVALTIHFEPMHVICEALIELLQERKLEEASSLVGELPARLVECKGIAEGNGNGE